MDLDRAGVRSSEGPFLLPFRFSVCCFLESFFYGFWNQFWCLVWSHSLFKSESIFNVILYFVFMLTLQQYEVLFWIVFPIKKVVLCSNASFQEASFFITKKKNELLSVPFPVQSVLGNGLLFQHDRHRFGHLL